LIPRYPAAIPRARRHAFRVCAIDDALFSLTLHFILSCPPDASELQDAIILRAAHRKRRVDTPVLNARAYAQEQMRGANNGDAGRRRRTS
jgi:hypothetical protein